MITSDPNDSVTPEAENVDYTAQGLFAIANNLNTSLTTPNVWSTMSLETIKAVAESKTYFTGMTWTSERPLVPTDDKYSAITLKNRETNDLCVYTWVNDSETLGNQ